jgi:hypothetical protein
MSCFHREGRHPLKTRGFAVDVSRWRLPTPERVVEACTGGVHSFASLRYRGSMKKSKIPKLVVRRETLRALARVELTHAVGGDAAQLFETGATTCPAPGIKQPPPA